MSLKALSRFSLQKTNIIVNVPVYRVYCICDFLLELWVHTKGRPEEILQKRKWEFCFSQLATCIFLAYPANTPDILGYLDT